MERCTRQIFLRALSALVLSACGGGSSVPAPTLHTVTIAWDANREAAVNTTGGGYAVAISGQAPIDVPYVSGPSAPTSTTATLISGSYSVTVTAYSALKPTGSVSAAYPFTVPY